MAVRVEETANKMQKMVGCSRVRMGRQLFRADPAEPHAPGFADDTHDKRLSKSASSKPTMASGCPRKSGFTRRPTAKVLT